MGIRPNREESCDAAKSASNTCTGRTFLLIFIAGVGNRFIRYWRQSSSTSPARKALVWAATYCAARVVGTLLARAATGSELTERRVVASLLDAAMDFPVAFLMFWPVFAFLERRRKPAGTSRVESLAVPIQEATASDAPDANAAHSVALQSGNEVHWPPPEPAAPRRPIGSIVVECPSCGHLTPARTEPGEHLNARCRGCGVQFVGLTRTLTAAVQETPLPLGPTAKRRSPVEAVVLACPSCGHLTPKLEVPGRRLSAQCRGCGLQFNAVAQSLTFDGGTE